ncbi:hypothetical protein H5410_036313 [Solanum commersonii]|uniref:Uncharacterized protein n=1 Tax=Solanum commersonii TaxID=4109 RepID=A0A9J5Y3U6_SOLCO|nr:hypothetical protein H5410_036313 [Solanum commersonii]
MYLFWSSELGMVRATWHRLQASKDERRRCCRLNKPTGPGVRLHQQCKREKMTRKLDVVCSLFSSIAATSMNRPQVDKMRRVWGQVVPFMRAVVAIFFRSSMLLLYRVKRRCDAIVLSCIWTAEFLLILERKKGYGVGPGWGYLGGWAN